MAFDNVTELLMQWILIKLIKDWSDLWETIKAYTNQLNSKLLRAEQ